MNPESLSVSNLESLSISDEKRDGYLSWDEYFMATAFLASMRSKDPATQVGAAIVNDKNRIVGENLTQCLRKSYFYRLKTIT
jgi:deoxycytidylate deaminase